jgi:hypothetical protein
MFSRFMGHHRLTTLTDVARYGYWVKLQCPCGHIARMDPMKLLNAAVAKRRSTRLADLPKMLKCGSCGGKDFQAEHCFAPDNPQANFG